MKMHQTGRKAVCLILALLMALSLVACGPASESAAAGAQTATGTAKGFGGDVTVTITVENGKITAASAEGASETEGVGSVAVEQLPQQMVDSQTLEVDAIAGATFELEGIIEDGVKYGSKNSYLKAKGLLPPDEGEEETDWPSEI